MNVNMTPNQRRVGFAPYNTRKGFGFFNAPAQGFTPMTSQPLRQPYQGSTNMQQLPPYSGPLTAQNKQQFWSTNRQSSSARANWQANPSNVNLGWRKRGQGNPQLFAQQLHESLVNPPTQTYSPFGTPPSPPYSPFGPPSPPSLFYPMGQYPAAPFNPQTRAMVDSWIKGGKKRSQTRRRKHMKRSRRTKRT